MCDVRQRAWRDGYGAGSTVFDIFLSRSVVRRERKLLRSQNMVVRINQITDPSMPLPTSFGVHDHEGFYYFAHG